jgi:hypothetical protein
LNTQEKLIGFINQQLAFNTGKSLFYTDGNQQLAVAPSLVTLEALCRNSGQLSSMVMQLKQEGSYQETLSHIAGKVITMLLEANQFLNFKHDDIVRLQNLYDKVIRQVCHQAGEMAEETVRGLLDAHYLNLQDYLEETNGKEIFKKYRERPLLFEVACANYSADFQLSLLGVPVKEIREPVMDIGCGESANLVFFLRGVGVETVGLDRDAKASHCLFKQNWFEYCFEPNTWGTLISHAAFSNHFMHHHMRADGKYEAYARKYMEILNSLKIGGSFIYSPGLPFMEELIRSLAIYRVERNPCTTKITRVL